MSDTASRVLRTLLQLIAAGAFTEIFLQIAKDVPESAAPYIVLISTLLVTLAQNVIEKSTGTMLLRPQTTA